MLVGVHSEVMGLQEPVLGLLSLRLGFEGGFSVRKIAERVKRTVTKVDRAFGVTERTPYAIGLNFVTQDRKEELAREYGTALEIFGAAKETECGVFSRKGELDLPLLRQALALAASEIRDLNSTPSANDFFPSVAVLVVTQDSDIPLWASAMHRRAGEIGGVPLSVVLDHVYLVARPTPVQNYQMVPLSFLCDELKIESGLPFAVLNSEMFPALPSLMEPTLDMARLGNEGADMIDRFITMSTDLSPEQKEALKLYVIGTTVPESGLASIVEAGVAYLSSSRDHEATRLEQFIARTASVGVAETVGAACAKRWNIAYPPSAQVMAASLGLWTRQVVDKLDIVLENPVVDPSKIMVVLLGENPLILPIPDTRFTDFAAEETGKTALAKFVHTGREGLAGAWTAASDLAEFRTGDGSYAIPEAHEAAFSLRAARNRDTKGLFRWHPNERSSHWSSAVVDFLLMAQDGRPPMGYVSTVFGMS